MRDFRTARLSGHGRRSRPPLGGPASSRSPCTVASSVTDSAPTDWKQRCASAAAEHSAWGVDADALIETVRAAWPEGAPPSLHVEDLTLAFACRAGNERAVAEFLRRYQATMSAEAAKVDASSTFVAEANARLRERLLAPRADAPARIGSYLGRGSLSDWVRVAAARNALNLVRDRGSDRKVRADAVSQLVGESTPELRYLADRYRDEVNAAVGEAFGSLQPEERNVLRLHYVDGVGLGELGVLYGVHKSTMSRRVARVRDSIMQAACEGLAERLAAPPTEVAALLELMRSQIEVTLSRVLGDSQDESR